MRFHSQFCSLTLLRLKAVLPWGVVVLFFVNGACNSHTVRQSPTQTYVKQTIDASCATIILIDQHLCHDIKCSSYGR